MFADAIAGHPPSDLGALERDGQAWEAAHAAATAQLKYTLNRSHELDDGDEEYRAAVATIIRDSLGNGE
jgi:hypothetical protein